MGVTARTDEELSRHLATRTGGKCPLWLVVHQEESLLPGLQQLGELGLGWWVLGAGTRTVVRDGGIRKAVVRLGCDFQRICRDGEIWEIGAGTPIPALLWRVATAGRGGLEWLVGQPGSLGAALLLDGRPGCGEWDATLKEVRFLRGKRILTGTLEEARKGRTIILSARFRLESRDADRIVRELERRLGASAGEKDMGWAWLSGAGNTKALRSMMRRVSMDGVSLRSVLIPDSAPEMMVNLGAGTTRDFWQLQRSVIERVQRFRGANLESNKRWIGVNQGAE